MKNYIEINIKVLDDQLVDLYIGQLSNIGFDGFEQTEEGLKAYINAEQFDKLALENIADTKNWDFELKNIEEQNWNTLWESNFQPIKVDDFVGIRAYFHSPIQDVEQEIVITPKMSFGTGHHATTYMMIQQMHDLDFQNKTVLDFGTGTGILAILAEKLKAKSILAIDNDEWSIENAKENIQANDCHKITLELTSSIYDELPQFDLILANINRNIIIENWESMDQHCKDSGYILLSGLLAQDEETIQLLAEKSGWTLEKSFQKLQWISLLYKK